jgi:uncharacterized membrane protein
MKHAADDHCRELQRLQRICRDFNEIAYLAQFDPHAPELGVVGYLVNIAICYSVAKPVEGIGIAMPALLSRLVATALAPEAAPPLAFVIGVVGPLIETCLLHLRVVEAAQTGMASIGGAGTFDGIVLSGIIAAYLA